MWNQPSPSENRQNTNKSPMKSRRRVYRLAGFMLILSLVVVAVRIAYASTHSRITANDVTVMLVQSATYPIVSPSSSPVSVNVLPTFEHAPCDGDSTRTLTPTASLTPTYDLRSHTPTATSTHYPFFRMIMLLSPFNCAVLHRNSIPQFEFTGGIGGPFTTTLYLNGPARGRIEYVQGKTSYYVSKDGKTVDYLPDGLYAWYVESVKFESLAGKSETWIFRIDTRCNCTDTPTPTASAICPPPPTLTPTITPSGPTLFPPPAGDLGWYYLRGRVIDTDGQPVAGAMINYTKHSIVNSLESGTAVTIEDGSFCTNMVFLHDTDKVTIKANAGIDEQTKSLDGYSSSYSTFDFTLSP